MALLKKLLPPLLTVLLVAAAALLPPSLSRLRDTLTLQGIHAEEITAFPSSSGLSTLEKLSLLCSGREDGSDFIQSHQDFSVSRGQDILTVARRELSLLEDMGIIPVSLDQSGLEIKSIAMVTYTDPADLSRSVSIWEAVILTGDWMLIVIMDTETEKIFEVTLELSNDSSSDSVTLDDPEGAFAVSSPVPKGPGAVPDLMKSSLEQYAAYLGVSLESFDAVSEPVCYRASITDTDLFYYFWRDDVFFYSLLLERSP